MNPDRFDEAIHVAELAGLAVYARAVLARAVSAEPDVVSLRVACSVTASGADVDCELVGATGMALGGFSL